MPTGTKLPPGPLTRAVATVLEALMTERKISQAAIGRTHLDSVMYISQSQVSRFFAHAKGIDVDQLNGLCKIAGVSVREVVERAEGLGVSNVTPIRPVGGPTEDLREVASETIAEHPDDTDDQYDA